MKWIRALLCFLLGHRWLVQTMLAEQWLYGHPAVGRVHCSRCRRHANVEREVSLWRFGETGRRVRWRLDDELDREWHRRRAHG